MYLNWEWLLVNLWLVEILPEKRNIIKIKLLHVQTIAGDSQESIWALYAIYKPFLHDEDSS